MAIAGYKVRLRKSGDTTAVTGEAMTGLTATSFQITSAARRCLDPEVAFQFYDGVTPVTPTTVQFEFGIAHFAAAPGGAVTFDGSYRPLTTSDQDIAEGTQVTLSLSRDLLDTTVFGASGVRSRIAALKDASIAIDVISSPAAYSAMFLEFSNGAQVCLEVDPDGASGTADAFRAWGIIENLERSASVDGLIESSLTFQVSARLGPSGFAPGYSWGSLA
jgi:hypothetical protein